MVSNKIFRLKEEIKLIKKDCINEIVRLKEEIRNLISIIKNLSNSLKEMKLFIKDFLKDLVNLSNSNGGLIILKESKIFNIYQIENNQKIVLSKKSKEFVKEWNNYFGEDNKNVDIFFGEKIINYYPFKGKKVESYIILPLRERGILIGAILLYKNSGYFSDLELEIIELIGNVISIFIVSFDKGIKEAKLNAQKDVIYILGYKIQEHLNLIKENIKNPEKIEKQLLNIQKILRDYIMKIEDLKIVTLYDLLKELDKNLKAEEIYKNLKIDTKKEDFNLNRLLFTFKSFFISIKSYIQKIKVKINKKAEIIFNLKEAINLNEFKEDLDFYSAFFKKDDAEIIYDENKDKIIKISVKIPIVNL